MVLLAWQLYANDNAGIMPGYTFGGMVWPDGTWEQALAKYVAPVGFSFDENTAHDLAAVYNCPACDSSLLASDLIEATDGYGRRLTSHFIVLLAAWPRRKIGVRYDSMFSGKPIIGIVGGIGSGKSFVAGLFGELGCVVISSDQQVYRAYETAEVKDTLRQWWGEAVFREDGAVDRKKIAALVFTDEPQRRRLEGLLHPLVVQERVEIMERAIISGGAVAFVWDTPLLFEAGLHQQCDAVVFVECPLEMRYERVRRQRAWSREQLLKRENFQWALDKKRDLAEYTVVNTADADEARVQVREVLSRILAIFSK